MAQMEPAKDATLTFYNGDLLQITIKHDRYSGEGRKASDMVDVISARSSVAVKPIKRERRRSKLVALTTNLLLQQTRLRCKGLRNEMSNGSGQRNKRSNSNLMKPDS
jgi:hypothetical protein